ncbi:HK97 family phage portal protein [Rhodobacter sp. JA431]|nr:phage portal protein [Rhodobacter sp. JA431]SOB98710.1 HK97 family phage portal protein [Rhodobacter sp. JA431]
MAFNLFQKPRVAAPPERKASVTGRIVALAAGAGRPVWGPRDSASLTRAGFTANPVGFRAVKLIAEAGAAVPLICADATRRYEVHPLLDLIARPNPGQGRAELFEALLGQILLSGNGYVEAVAQEPGLPRELHVLRADRMQVVPGPDGWPVAYDYAVGGRKHRFEMTGAPDPICHIKSFHPSDDHYGLSPMQAAAVAVEVHNAASGWSKALLDNAARPSGAIVYTGADGQGTFLSDAEKRRLLGLPPAPEG